MSLHHPNQSQLLEAISEFLKEEVSPTLQDKALAYRMKVAINALGIAQRESEQSQTLAEVERAAYLPFVEDNGQDISAQLAEAISTQQLSINDPTLITALKKVSMAKMAIDNPRYATYRELIASQH